MAHFGGFREMLGSVAARAMSTGAATKMGNIAHESRPPPAHTA
jgi:hypothetical protein